MRHMHKVFLVGAAVLGLVLTGCTTTPPAQQTPTRGNTDANTDPTALYLHDLAGGLLLYYATHRRLPDRLEDIAPADTEAQNSAARDPASGQPFAYRPQGLPLAGLPGRLIVYQAAPINPAGRWGLSITGLDTGGKIVTYVQCVPESVLHSALAGP